MALVSMLLLTGYTCAAMELGCARESLQQQAEHGSTPDHCHCVCHQAQDPATGQVLVALMATDAPSRPPVAEFPPEAPPAGIEHPPQLG